MLTLEPILQIRKNILGLVGDKTSAATVLGANFSAGFVAGTLASAVTCPLDVAKTRRQIEVISQSHDLVYKISIPLITLPLPRKVRNLDLASSGKVIT